MKENSYLSRVGLVNVKMNEEAFTTFCKYVETSHHLDTIDLSWNEIKPK
jgi:hypothetical protein